MGFIDSVKAFFVRAEVYMLHHKTVAIVSLSVAAILFMVMFCCCCWHCCCRKKQKKKIKEKLKLKSLKPKKFLNRIQPGRRVKKLMEDVGTMTFCLKYDPLTQLLSVKVIQSDDIPIRDLSGYSYSYVEIKLFPLHKDSDTSFKTELVRPASFHPSYGDVFNFCIPPKEVKEQILYLFQYERNKFSQQDGIGQVIFDLKSDLSITEKEFQKKIMPYNPLIGVEKEMGAVFLSMEYDDDWQLIIEVEEADIIPEDEEKDKYTSYVTLTLLNSDGEPMEKRKTSEVSGTLQPVFDERFEFSLPDSMFKDAQILLKLKCKRLLRKNKIHGQSIIKMDSEVGKKVRENNKINPQWFQVFKKTKLKGS